MQQSRAITRKSASNLALAFVLLPRERRDAMATLYAFCREVDDVADEDRNPVSQRNDELAAWRADIHLACNGGEPTFPVNRELQPAIRNFGLPFELFDELIKGCEMDLHTTRYESWADLELYCYRVASVVGLLSLKIFSPTNPRCHEYAIALGHALQLTNILRDVQNDAARGRIYLPLEELRRHGVGEAEILAGQYSNGFARLAATVADRAKSHYQTARRTLPPEDRSALVAAEMMGAVYWRLLAKLERHQYNVFTGMPIRLSRPHKLALVFRSWLRHLLRLNRSDYGTV